MLAEALRYLQPDGDAPEHLRCPLTHAVFSDPVTTAAGHTYSRNAIDRWLQESYTDPLTRMNLSRPRLVPDRGVAAQVDAFWHDVVGVHARDPRACAAASVIQRAYRRYAAAPGHRPPAPRRPRGPGASRSAPATDPADTAVADVLRSDARQIARACLGLALAYRGTARLLSAHYTHCHVFMLHMGALVALGGPLQHWLLARGVTSQEARRVWARAEHFGVDACRMALVVRDLAALRGAREAGFARITLVLALGCTGVRLAHDAGRLADPRRHRNVLAAVCAAVLAGAHVAGDSRSAAVATLLAIPVLMGACGRYEAHVGSIFGAASTLLVVGRRFGLRL